MLLDNYLLQELVIFAQTGTLAQTARRLNVTQPTITRGLQKLESELAVQLFDRQPNRLTLTTTGKLAAQLAEKLLAAHDQTVTEIQNFARSQEEITIATTIPGPLNLLNQVDRTSLPPLKINANLVRDSLVQRLQANEATVIIADHALTLTTTTTTDTTTSTSNKIVGSDELIATYLGTENLAVNLNRFMYQAGQTTISFTELAGISFLVLTEIGPWRQIIQHNIPRAKFLYQKEQAALTEISQYSDFPYFSTNLSPLRPASPETYRDHDSRIQIPITDPTAQMPVYANYLQRNRAQVQPLIDQLIDLWPH
ncbi:LysR family transcriptional regulator [Lapidilactobacillus luobeiensis]|uniref:LysR family transcriptional regulator n=1 Tax=Lapidilactobacillus luobeiensis TaxID=2950371 RepID=UPI0021C432D5|nr:LysR family transcriptional regulator [Lapidilactobacillus luobeiensis]